MLKMIGLINNVKKYQEIYNYAEKYKSKKKRKYKSRI